MKIKLKRETKTYTVNEESKEKRGFKTTKKQSKPLNQHEGREQI